MSYFLLNEYEWVNESWPSRQLLSARKHVVSYRIVAYRTRLSLLLCDVYHRQKQAATEHGSNEECQKNAGIDVEKFTWLVSKHERW